MVEAISDLTLGTIMAAREVRGFCVSRAQLPSCRAASSAFQEFRRDAKTQKDQTARGVRNCQKVATGSNLEPDSNTVAAYVPTDKIQPGPKAKSNKSPQGPVDRGAKCILGHHP